MGTQEKIGLIRRAGHSTGRYNPGALRVAKDMIDADAADAVQFAIDEGIVGPELWLFYKDVHGANLNACVDSLRKEQSLNELSHNRDSKFYKGELS